ncbi:MAG: alpha/beta hydrolase [Synechococcales cyanobacterium RM1_1_8]|nr:alpha/beta hydrolase [Synechococcales cyanobacterium RM1_1_8]
MNPEPSPYSDPHSRPSPEPQRLIFVQHGWSDTGRYLGDLVRSIAPPQSEVIAPSLNFVNTWLRIERLVQEKEAIAQTFLHRYPDLPLRIVGHSMGGLIWTELLHRHPDWWGRVESFVLVGSPIGGSDVARLIDPWGLGLGIAADLGRDRRDLAEQIALHIPTLVIASDLGNGSDGLVALEATKVPGSELRVLRQIRHAAMRYSAEVGQEIADFWARGTAQPEQLNPVAERAIRALRSVPGMTAAGYSDFAKARIRCDLGEGITLRTWKNPAQVQHVFIGDRPGNCLFAGYVGWGHSAALTQQLQALATAGKD